jgi:hypothetical protein
VTGEVDKGQSDSWIHASGVRGLARLEVPVGAPGAEARKYTVRIHVRDARSGDLRIEVQGKAVATGEDLAREAGPSGGTIVKELRGVEAEEKLELRLRGDAARATISALEIVVEG